MDKLPTQEMRRFLVAALDELQSILHNDEVAPGLRIEAARVMFQIIWKSKDLLSTDPAQDPAPS